MASIISAGTTSGTAINISGDTSGVLQLATNGSTTAVTVDTSQNVGIGTASPGRKLDVYATGSSVPATIRGDQTQARICFKDSVTALDYTVGIGSIGENLASYTGGTERMRIDSSGRLCIGVSSAAYSTACVMNVNVDAVSASGGAWVSKAASTSTAFHLNFQNGNGGVGGISTSGSATQYVTSSDYRLKNSITPMTGALAKVAQLKPVIYKWNSDNSDGEGFIAHELEEICPHAVTGEKDAVDADGNPKYQGIDVSFLVATLTAAIQELNAKVEAQATTIAELQAKVG